MHTKRMVIGALFIALCFNLLFSVHFTTGYITPSDDTDDVYQIHTYNSTNPFASTIKAEDVSNVSFIDIVTVEIDTNNHLEIVFENMSVWQANFSDTAFYSISITVRAYSITNASVCNIVIVYDKASGWIGAYGTIAIDAYSLLYDSIMNLMNTGFSFTDIYNLTATVYYRTGSLAASPKYMDFYPNSLVAVTYQSTTASTSTTTTDETDTSDITQYWWVFVVAPIAVGIVLILLYAQKKIKSGYCDADAMKAGWVCKLKPMFQRAPKQ